MYESNCHRYFLPVITKFCMYSVTDTPRKHAPIYIFLFNPNSYITFNNVWAPCEICLTGIIAWKTSYNKLVHQSVKLFMNCNHWIMHTIFLSTLNNVTCFSILIMLDKYHGGNLHPPVITQCRESNPDHHTYNEK